MLFTVTDSALPSYYSKKHKAVIFLLVTVNIEKNQDKGISAFFKGNEYIREYYITPELTVLDLRCICNRKKPYPKDLSRMCAGLTDTVLCSSEIQLPRELDRFCDNTLNIRMMENTILHLLNTLPPKSLSIGLYDPHGNCRGLCEKLLPLCRSITAATEMKHFYSALGALPIVDKLSELYPCDILIHRDAIASGLPHERNTLVFSAYPPDIRTDENTIFSYRTPASKELLSLIPKGTDRQYFLCGLYSLCKKTELGDTLPEICMTSHGAVSIEYLRSRLLASRDIEGSL